ncbi:MAG: PAS domain S-box protein [Burkholderiaceae bacterium]
MAKQHSTPASPTAKAVVDSEGSGDTSPRKAAPTEARGTGFPIVGVGASAGGLEAYIELLSHLKLDTGMAFVLVQHLDPVHESALTQLLARATKMPVHEVTNDLRVEPNHVYVIPPNTSLRIEAGVLKLQPRDKARTPARSIDVFFESLAEDQHEGAIGVILSGTASDGTIGLEAIKAEGGITFAQDDSARFASMPRSAVAAGCVDFVLAPQAIAEELARLAVHPYVAGAASRTESSSQTRPEADHADATSHQADDKALPSGGSGTPDVGAVRSRTEADQASAQDPTDEDQGFQRVLSLLRNHCGVDFTLYRSSTIQRRIARRMLLCRQDTLPGYAEFLRGNAKELDTLFSDVLISVTSFFRNPDAFEVLQREVLPKLLAQRGDGPLRVWVLGCSTGQEAYSIAMAFVEAAEKEPEGRKLQIFATDLNDALLDKARQGLYAKTLAGDLSPERLHRFFVEEGGGYRVIKPLREMVVFARQNIISDPPFSRIDIITCRNLLIYLEPSLQKKIFPLFHYALKPHGFLWLGASESTGGFTELFEPLNRKQKIYTKKATATPAFTLPIGSLRTQRMDREGATQRLKAGADPSAEAGVDDTAMAREHSPQREADRVIAGKYAPPGVLISAARQILQFRGITSDYLEAPSGAATFDVLKMAREGLMLPLRAAINQASKENKPARRDNVRIERNGTIRCANLEVIPLHNLRERCFLVLFEEAGTTIGQAANAADLASAEPASVAPNGDDRSRIAELESDLAETRNYLQTIEETHEASSEELQAASEELQSANEELQSLNEELTTSKEELESTNEELTTINDEMAHRNTELSVLNNDLVNIENSAQQVIVLLDRTLGVRRFSAQAARQFNLVVGDIGRPIGHIRHRLELPDLESMILEVIDSLSAQQRELRDQDGRWFSLHVRPYVTVDKRVEGAVMMLADIDVLKRSEQALQVSEAQYHAMFEATSVGVIESDPDSGKLLRVNGRFAQMLGHPSAEMIGLTLLELVHPDDRPEHAAGVSQLLRGGLGSYEAEQRLLRKDGSILWAHITVNLVREPAGRALRKVDIVLDIGERRRAQEAAAHLAAIVNSSEDAIVTIDFEHRIRSWNAGAEHLFGYTAMQAIGQAATLLSPADRFDPVSGVLARVQRGEAVASLETVRQHQDGHAVDVSVTISPILDAAGQVVAASAIARDITERIRLEARQHDNDRRFREMVDALPAAVYTTDVEGRLTHANPAAVALAGSEPEPVLGHAGSVSWKVYTADGTPLPNAELPMATALREDRPVRGIEAELERPDGTRVWVRPYPTPVHDAEGHLVGGINMLLDITESRQAEVALREADRRKNEFLAMLAHELRNPLAPIRNALQILHAAPGLAAPGAATEDVPGGRRVDPGRAAESALQMIERQVGQMVRLVDDLLDVSRISLGKIDLRPERVNLAAVLHQVEQASRSAFEGRGNSLTLSLPEQPVVLKADPARLVQVIGNLVNNACKFTPRGGRVELSAALEGTDTVVIRVRDNGIGIEAGDLARVFTLFTQVDSSLGRTAGGLGIGLALVKDLVALHGGTVAVHSQGAGQGSDFEVRLPIVVGSPEATTEPGEPAPLPTNARRILVVDDNRDAADSLAYLLQFNGHETELAYDGLAAVQAALSFQPAVILMDLGLPKLDGYEAARQIREQRADKRPLMVALTGWGQEEDRRRSTEAGFDAHLVKPVALDALLKLLG